MQALIALAVLAVGGFLYMSSKKLKFVSTAEAGKTYMMGMTGLAPTDLPNIADPSKWPPGWSNVQFVYFPGQGGTLPTGEFGTALQNAGWTPQTGAIVKVTRTGASIPMYPGSIAYEVTN